MRYVASVLVTLVVLTACDGSPTTGSIASPDLPSLNMAPIEIVNGSGHVTATGADTDWRTFSFHAIKRGDGSVSGSFTVQTRQADPEDTLLGTIVCVSVVGNQAWMVGLVTESQSPVSPPGTYTRFRVVDNGEGEGSLPDQITLMDVGILTFPPYCTTLSTHQPLLPVEAGNVQVR